MTKRLALSMLVLLAACVAPEPAPPPAAEHVPGTPLPRRGDEISACGQLFHIGTPVVLWNDPGGYDAYRVQKRFSEDPPDAPEKARYGNRRNLPDGLAEQVRAHGWTLQQLQEVVHLFVVHYDVAGTSKRCFQILQDMRGLSVHFLLDVDGTIYQTLDLKERAWHATIANDHSVGIEIAHPGAYPQPGNAAMARWYGADEQGVFMKYPAFLGDPGVRTADFVARPARPEIVSGVIHGREFFQYDFTEAQYRALARLVAGLSRVFPRIRLQAPRGEDGSVNPTNLSAEALHAFEGVVGHWHVQRNKQDPGPAFQWDRVFGDARALLWPEPALHRAAR